MASFSYKRLSIIRIKENQLQIQIIELDRSHLSCNTTNRRFNLRYLIKLTIVNTPSVRIFLGSNFTAKKKKRDKKQCTNLIGSGKRKFATYFET